jgi:predicted nucleic acid-binding protein
MKFATEEVAYRAMLTLVEEAPLSGEAGELAALWLRALPTRSSEAIVRDAFIAATASLRNETIYTRNVRDFRRLYDDVTTY